MVAQQTDTQGFGFAELNPPKSSFIVIRGPQQASCHSFQTIEPTFRELISRM